MEANRKLAGAQGSVLTMDWDKLRVFHAVAEAGSFTHAGDTLNLSQSAVSRQISALEEALQVPLFHRHARGLRKAGHDRGAADRKQGTAHGPAEGDHHRGLRLALAGAAAALFSGGLSGNFHQPHFG